MCLFVCCGWAAALTGPGTALSQLLQHPGMGGAAVERDDQATVVRRLSAIHQLMADVYGVLQALMGRVEEEYNYAGLLRAVARVIIAVPVAPCY